MNIEIIIKVFIKLDLSPIKKEININNTAIKRFNEFLLILYNRKLINIKQNPEKKLLN